MGKNNPGTSNGLGGLPGDIRERDPEVFRWRGTWSATAIYVIDDRVAYNGSSYICTVGNIGVVPTNTGFWATLAQKGTDGTNGTDAFGYRYTFDSAITSSPASGEVRLNSATPSAATAMHVSETGRISAGSLNYTTALGALNNGSQITLQKDGDQNTYATYEIIAQVDNGSDRTLTISHIGSNGSFTDGDAVSLAPAPKGSAGTNGSNAYTTTTANFTQPNAGSTVTASVASSAWITVGQYLFVENGGTYIVTAIPGSTSVTLQNPTGYTGNAAPGSIVSSGAKVSPSDQRGTDGTPGTNGIDGVSGYGNRFTFDTSTSTGPASGRLRLNNATLASVTAIYVHETDRNSTSIAGFLDLLTNGTPIQLIKESVTTVYANYLVTSVADNGSDRTINVSHVSSTATGFANNDNVSLTFAPKGAVGDLSSVANWKWLMMYG